VSEERTKKETFTTQKESRKKMGTDTSWRYLMRAKKGNVHKLQQRKHLFPRY